MYPLRCTGREPSAGTNQPSRVAGLANAEPATNRPSSAKPVQSPPPLEPRWKASNMPPPHILSHPRDRHGAAEDPHAAGAMGDECRAEDGGSHRPRRAPPSRKRRRSASLECDDDEHQHHRHPRESPATRSCPAREADALNYGAFRPAVETPPISDYSLPCTPPDEVSPVAYYNHFGVYTHPALFWPCWPTIVCMSPPLMPFPGSWPPHCDVCQEPKYDPNGTPAASRPFVQPAQNKPAEAGRGGASQLMRKLGFVGSRENKSAVEDFFESISKSVDEALEKARPGELVLEANRKARAQFQEEYFGKLLKDKRQGHGLYDENDIKRVVDDRWKYEKSQKTKGVARTNPILRRDRQAPDRRGCSSDAVPIPGITTVGENVVT